MEAVNGRAARLHHPDGLRHRHDHQDRQGPRGQLRGRPQHRRADALRPDLDAHARRPPGRRPRPMPTASPNCPSPRCRTDDLRVVAPARRRFRRQRPVQLRLRRQRGAMDGLHLHRPARLSSRPHRALQGHPALAQRRRLRRSRRPRSRWTSRTPNRSRSIGRPSPPTPTAPFTTTSTLPPAPRSAITSSRSTRAKLHERQLRRGRVQEARVRSARHSRAKSRILQGETVQATIDARYYFGEPVSGAKVKYAVYRDRYWFPLWYDPDDDTIESPTPAIRRCRRSAAIRCPSRKASSMPTASSPSASRPPSPTTSSTTATAWRRASPTRRNARSSATAGVIATYGSFVLNVQPDRYFYAARQHRRRSPWRRATTTTTGAHARAPGAAAVELGARGPYGDAKGATDVDTGADGSANARLDHSRRGRPTGCASPPARPRAATWKTSPTSGSPAAVGTISRRFGAQDRARSSPTRRATARRDRAGCSSWPASPIRRCTSAWKAATCASTS